MPRSDASLRSELTPTLKTESEHLVPLMQFFGLHRMAIPYHVMEAFPQWFGGDHPKTMRHLNWLHNQGWLRRHGNKDSGYTFNITQVGYERCRDTDINIPLHMIPYTYKEPSGKRARHELLITKYATSLLKCRKDIAEFNVLEQARFGLQNLTAIDHESNETLYPFEHLYPDFCYMAQDRGGMIFCMVEAVCGVESIDDLRGMIEKYERWERSRAAQLFLTNLYRKLGAKSPQPQYQVHSILESTSWKHTDAWKERMLLMQTFHANEGTQARFLTITKEELDKAFAEGLTINSKIWHRGKDLVEKRERWQRAQDGTRTRLVDGFMRSLPTYPLFA